MEGFRRVVRVSQIFPLSLLSLTWKLQTDLPTPATRLRGTKRPHSSSHSEDLNATSDLTSSFTSAGLSPDVADVLFDFFVEHISKANPSQSQTRYADYLKRHNEQQGEGNVCSDDTLNK